MIKNNKVVNWLVALMMIFSLTVGAFHTVEVKAAEAPVISVKYKVNGSWVDLPNGQTSYSQVKIVSNVPVQFYMGPQLVSESYTFETYHSGTGSFDFYGVDKSGSMSNKVSFNIMSEPATISSVELHSGQAGLTTVNIKTGQMPVYYIVNGVKQDKLTPKGHALTLTENGKYTVKAVDEYGRETNTLTFTIPTTAKVTTTTTTTKKPPVTTKKPNTTKPVTTPAEIVLSLIGVENGGAINKDVTIEASEAVYFIVNGTKESKTAKALTLSKDGTYTVSAVNAKNVKSKEFTFTIDKVLPELTLEVGNVPVEPGIFEDAVTIKSNKSGVFSINDEVKDSAEKSEMVISESGSYTVKVVDAAGNEASVSFVVNMKEVEEPTKEDDKPSSGMSWLMYVLLGMVAGAGIVGAGFYFMNKKKEEAYEDEEDESDED